MNRTVLVAAATTAGVCVVFFAMQRQATLRLKEELREKTVGIRSLEIDVSDGGEPGRIFGRLRGSGATSEAVVPGSTSADELDSATRIELAREKFESMLSGLGRMDVTLIPLIKLFPELLRVVEDLSIDEMRALADSIDPASSDWADSAKFMIGMISAEIAPEQLLGNAEAMSDKALRHSVIRALGEKDPEAARRWLLESNLSEGEVAELGEALMLKVMESDLSEGIELFREFVAGSDFFVSLGGEIPGSQLPELGVAIGKSENTDVRAELLDMYLTSSLLYDGVTETRRRLEVLDLTPEELERVFEQGSVTASETPEFIDWISEAQPLEQQEVMIPELVSSWASEDFNQAGKWLGSMEPSSVKDESIRAFAKTVVEIDPQAAMIWTLEIRDEALRAEAFKEASKKWLARDEAAAQAWLETEGLGTK